MRRRKKVNTSTTESTKWLFTVSSFTRRVTWGRRYMQCHSNFTAHAHPPSTPSLCHRVSYRSPSQLSTCDGIGRFETVHPSRSSLSWNSNKYFRSILLLFHPSGMEETNAFPSRPTVEVSQEVLTLTGVFLTIVGKSNCLIFRFTFAICLILLLFRIASSTVSKIIFPFVMTITVR